MGASACSRVRQCFGTIDTSEVGISSLASLASPQLCPADTRRSVLGDGRIDIKGVKADEDTQYGTNDTSNLDSDCRQSTDSAVDENRCGTGPPCWTCPGRESHICWERAGLAERDDTSNLKSEGWHGTLCTDSATYAHQCGMDSEKVGFAKRDAKDCDDEDLNSTYDDTDTLSESADSCSNWQADEVYGVTDEDFGSHGFQLTSDRVTDLHCLSEEANDVVQSLSNSRAVLSAIERRIRQLEKEWGGGIVELSDAQMQLCQMQEEVRQKDAQLQELNIAAVQTCKNEAKASMQEQRRQIQHLAKLLARFPKDPPLSTPARRRTISQETCDVLRHLSITRKDVIQLEVQAATLKEYWTRGRLNSDNARAQLEEYEGTVQSIEDGLLSKFEGSSSCKQVAELRWDISPRLNRLKSVLDDVAEQLSSD